MKPKIKQPYYSLQIFMFYVLITMILGEGGGITKLIVSIIFLILMMIIFIINIMIEIKINEE